MTTTLRLNGSKNADADGLSRRQEGETEERIIFPDVIKAVSMSVTVDCPLIDSVYVSDALAPTPLITEDIPEQLLQSHGLQVRIGERLNLRILP